MITLTEDKIETGNVKTKSMAYDEPWERVTRKRKSERQHSGMSKGKEDNI